MVCDYDLHSPKGQQDIPRVDVTKIPDFLLDRVQAGVVGGPLAEAEHPEGPGQAGEADRGGEHLQEAGAGRLVHPLPAWQEHGPHDLQGVHGETSQENVGECPK